MKELGRVRSIARLTVVIALLAVGLALAPSRPAAAATTCTSPVESGTIRGSVVVPAGESCFLGSVIVTGGVTVNAGATLFIVIGAEIRGNVTATGADFLAFSDSTIRGSFSSSGAADVQVESMEFRGNVAISGTTISAALRDSVFRGSVVLTNNGDGPGFNSGYFENNTVAGSVTCRGNDFIIASGNTVRGSVSAECGF